MKKFIRRDVLNQFIHMDVLFARTVCMIYAKSFPTCHWASQARSRGYEFGPIRSEDWKQPTVNNNTESRLYLQVVLRSALQYGAYKL